MFGRWPIMIKVRPMIIREVKEADKKKPSRYSNFMESIKFVLSLHLVGRHIKKEKIRSSREEHILLLGTRESGMDLVGKALFGTDELTRNRFSPKYSKTSNDNGVLGKAISEKKSSRDTSSSKLEVVEGFNRKSHRKIKITSIYLDEISVNDLSSLSISEDYSLVYCFPVSHRFKTEDFNLLETFLQYRQREDFQRITVAFTYKDRLEIDTKDYIRNVSSHLQEVLNKCGNQYMFISSSEEDSKENENEVEHLIKPLPSDDFIKDVFVTVAFYFGPHLYYVFK